MADPQLMRNEIRRPAEMPQRRFVDPRALPRFERER
jgi:hypothetical protein